MFTNDSNLQTVLNLGSDKEGSPGRGTFVQRGLLFVSHTAAMVSRNTRHSTGVAVLARIQQSESNEKEMS